MISLSSHFGNLIYRAGQEDKEISTNPDGNST